MRATQIEIPTLVTERLTLRASKRADFDAYADMVTSPRAKYMEEGLDRDGAWNWFMSDIGHWSLFGHGCLMIEVSETGQVVGGLGVTQGISFPEPEMGWMLYEGCEGKGYAFEAASAYLNWAFRDFGFSTLVSYVAPQNTRSRMLAERLGASIDPEAKRPPGESIQDTLVYRHSPEWWLA